MPVTPDQFAAALAAHGHVSIACKALGISRQAAHQRADLAPLIAAHRQARAASRHPGGQHDIALPSEAVERLDARAAVLRTTRGPKLGSRSAAAVEKLTAALAGELPAPVPATGQKVKLRLGAVWEQIGERIGTTDPQAIAGRVRAILGA